LKVKDATAIAHFSIYLGDCLMQIVSYLRKLIKEEGVLWVGFRTPFSSQKGGARIERLFTRRNSKCCRGSKEL